jgi:hypothetical protein
MIAQFNKDTRVYIVLVYDGARWYLTSVETARRPATGELYLKGTWDSDHRHARTQTFETASLIRERLKRESGITIYIALQAGDSAELIQGE